MGCYCCGLDPAPVLGMSGTRFCSHEHRAAWEEAVAQAYAKRMEAMLSLGATRRKIFNPLMHTTICPAGQDT